MRILIIENDTTTRKFLESNLESCCFAVDSVPDGARGSFMARTNEYDLILCAYIVAEKTAPDMCREIRNAEKHTPIIIISEHSDIDAKIECFEAGADDYIVKPCVFDEVLARIRVVLKRPRTIACAVFEIQDIRLETGTQRLLYKNKEVYLTRKEYALLEYLMRHRGRLLTRGMILEHVWDIDANPFSNTVETHIMNLRKKIRDMEKKRIVSVPGRGYMLRG